MKQTDSYIEQVKQFHEKHGYTVGLKLPEVESDPEGIASSQLMSAARVLKDISAQWEKGGRSPSDTHFDPRLLRAHLILEEIGETLEGLALKNEVKTLDGMADACFVLSGTGVTFDLPLDEAMQEVTRSNMTKGVRTGDVRLRNKGESYEPPDLARVIAEHRR